MNGVLAEGGEGWVDGRRMKVENEFGMSGTGPRRRAVSWMEAVGWWGLRGGLRDVV